ncbi:MAG: hypothetical protein KGJ98_10460 [Chloroflexota bacterium]|nr:hypothetical protein [Chloroflexota bacterium]
MLSLLWGIVVERFWPATAPVIAASCAKGIRERNEAPLSEASGPHEIERWNDGTRRAA